MGFYGNTTDTSKTHFQFDKIFSSRTEMEQACANGQDGVYTGRFVLIEYGQEAFPSGRMIFGYVKPEEENIIYIDSLCTKPYIYTEYEIVTNKQQKDWASYFELVNDNFYIKLKNIEQYDPTKTYYTHTIRNNDNSLRSDTVNINTIVFERDITTKVLNGKFYKCTGELIISQDGEEDFYTGKAKWELINLNSESGIAQYLLNFQKDFDTYQQNFDYRGYNATVWQKTYNEGSGQFILIARLEANIPQFEIHEDPPSELPVAPYIDSNSSNDTYLIKVPNVWGFQIKEANEEEPSDQLIAQKYYKYNQNNQLEIDTKENIRGDIYLNLKQVKDGHELSHKQYKFRDDNSFNEILISPTGKSGKKYYNNDGDFTESEDIQEVSIHLPIIGNMISDGYDLIYGTLESEGSNNIFTRPTDIQWYSGTASDELKQKGNMELGGKTYNLETLAGNLNTIHSLLGQIVYNLEGSLPTDPNTIATYSPNYLYKHNNIYYRKGKRIISEPSNSTDFEYIPIVPFPEEEKGENFPINKYYRQDTATTYVPINSWVDGVTYYLKSVQSDLYTPIDLEHYISSLYYYKDGENYICDQALYYPTYIDRTYYKNITVEEITNLTTEYQNDGSFYIYNNQKLIPNFNSEPDFNSTYYKISDKTALNGETPRYYYYPNLYYFKNSETNQLSLITESLTDFEAHRNNYINGTIYIYKYSDQLQQGFDINGQPTWYYEKIEEKEIGGVSILYSLPINQEINTITNETEARYKHLYIYDNFTKQYIAFDKISDLGKINGYNPLSTPLTLYDLNITSYEGDSLFIQGKYYYIEDRELYGGTYRSYYKDKTLHLNDKPSWYKITSITQVEKPFYLPDKYWYELIVGSRDFEISSSWEEDIIYYVKKVLYVQSDTFNQCPPGFQWNDYSVYVPPSVTLCSYKEEAAFIPVLEVGSDSGSLFELLLNLNKLYSADDEKTRDITTVRGLYNLLTDFMYKIKKLKPNRLLYVNNFGQIDSLEAQPDKMFITDQYGHIQTISLSELKNKLENI